MTMIRHKGRRYEWTFILDVFNNEIIASHISGRIGDGRPYFRCLEELKQLVKEQREPVTFHTDQGSIYSSKAFNDAYKGYNIIRSMSRVGTPTDNPVIPIQTAYTLHLQEKSICRRILPLGPNQNM